MNTDEQDDLWSLLGRAKTTDVSPFFSRNVLRAIREQDTVKWWQRGWQPLVRAGACASVLLLATITAVYHTRSSQTETVSRLAQQVSMSPDYQVINHLDELLASEETSVWLEK